MPVMTRSMTKIQDCETMRQILRKKKIGFTKNVYLSWYYTSYMDVFMDVYYTWKTMQHGSMTSYQLMQMFVQVQCDNKNI